MSNSKLSLRLSAIILTFFISYSSSAQSTYITVSGYNACLTEDYFDKLGDYSADRDLEAVQKLIDAQACFSLKAGVIVYVEEQRWNGVVEIRPKGQTVTVWTNIEAIESK